jgi:hypothetical protein
MKHSLVFGIITLFVFAIGIFSTWFFAFEGAPLAGMVLSTLATVTGILSAVVTAINYKEGN